MKPSKRLRSTTELIPAVDREVHNSIHRQCPVVPVLGHLAMLKIDSEFHVVHGNTLRTMDNLMFAIDRSLQSPNFHPLERAMGALLIDAVETQRPFLQGNIVLMNEL